MDLGFLPSFSFLELPPFSPVSFIKNANATIFCLDLRQTQSKGAEDGREHERRNDLNQGAAFYLAVPLDAPSLPLRLTAGKHSRGWGKRRLDFLFFFILKLKSPKKRENAVLVTLAGTFSFCSLSQSGKFHLLVWREPEEEQKLASIPGTKKDPQKRKMRKNNQREEGSQE